MKKISTLLLFILLMLGFAGCDQTGMGFNSAVKNFFFAPIQHFKDSIAHSEYKELKEKTQKDKKEEEEKKRKLEEKACETPPGDILDKDMKKLADAFKSPCECMSWADKCSKVECPCKLLCPDNFSIFKHPVNQPLNDLSKTSNALAFRNKPEVGKHKVTNGYCWGHANVTSQFNRLAFFNGSAKPPFDIKSADPVIQGKAIEYYKKIIDEISDNKAVEIPGFANLEALSKEPALQSHLADKVAENWSDNAMSWQGLKATNAITTEGEAYYKNVFKDIKERVDMHMRPTIVFNKIGEKDITHAVLVSSYKETADGMKICLDDNALDQDASEGCSYNMTIDKAGRLKYSGWDSEIGGLVLAHNNDADVVAQSHSLREKCLKDKDCAK